MAELEARQALLQARSLRVLVVAFGRIEGAQLWLQETGCTFNMLLDPQNKIYRSFGLGSSFSKVMKFDVLLKYSEYLANDRSLPHVPRHLEEDIFQMGGDFLLDEGGKVLLARPSKNPLERPTAKQLMEFMDAETTKN